MVYVFVPLHHAHTIMVADYVQLMCDNMPKCPQVCEITQGRIWNKAALIATKQVPEAGRRRCPRLPSGVTRNDTAVFRVSTAGVCKVVSHRKGIDGNEVELHQHMPKTVGPDDPRSKYGRQDEDFQIPRGIDGRRVRPVSFKHVAGIRCTPAQLSKSTKPPSHVWPTSA